MHFRLMHFSNITPRNNENIMKQEYMQLLLEQKCYKNKTGTAEKKRKKNKNPTFIRRLFTKIITTIVTITRNNTFFQNMNSTFEIGVVYKIQIIRNFYFSNTNTHF